MGHADGATPAAVKLLIRPELQPGRGRQSRADRSLEGHEASLERGHARNHRPTAQQHHWAARWILTVLTHPRKWRCPMSWNSHTVVRSKWACQGLARGRNRLLVAHPEELIHDNWTTFFGDLPNFTGDSNILRVGVNGIRGRPVDAECGFCS